MAVVTERPERVCGVHFFNPAPAMSLVEIIRPITASDETIATAKAFAEACGKGPVEVKDRAGFIVNALLFPYLNNAVRMLESGTASRDDIDAAMKGGCNFPMGPLALLDLVGLDTSLAILDALYDEFRDPNYAAMPLLRRMVTAGQLGRKSGQGFFDYSQADRPETLRTGVNPDRMRSRLTTPCRTHLRMPVEPPPTPWAMPNPLAMPTAAGWSCVGADLEPGTLLTAYRAGLVPMPVGEGPQMAWWSPDPRGVLPLDALRVPRSLRQSCRRYEIRYDTAFDEVIERPAPTPDAPHGLDHPGHPRGVPAAARPRLGAQQRGLVARRRHARRRHLWHGGRRLVRRRVDVPPRHRCVQGGSGRPGRPHARPTARASLFDVQWTTPHLVVARRGRHPGAAATSACLGRAPSTSTSPRMFDG